MREADETTRQRLRALLRERAMTPSELADALEVTPSSALRHVRHVARSLEHEDATLLVSPPACRACGFDGFDDLVNRPSRCPDCKSEDVAEPRFTVR